MKASITLAGLVALACAGCGGGGGTGPGPGDDGGDDTGAYADFLATCHEARDWFDQLGCSSSEDLCARDVMWLELTGDACYDELLGWWQCLDLQYQCEHDCDPNPSVDCTSAFCAANPTNEACTACLFGCPPPPPPG